MTLNYNLLLWVPYLLLLFLVLRFSEIYWRLRHVPSPRLAAFTDLWRLIAVWGGREETTYLDLHKKYGDLVRVGPNNVSISKPDVIQSIYGIGKGFAKASYA
jgi:hypothetical protein